MKERELLYFGAELLAVAVSLAMLMVDHFEAGQVLTGLSFVCALTGKLLVQRIGKPRRLDLVICLVCAAVSFAIGPEKLFPLLAVLFAEITDRLAGFRHILQLTTALTVLFWILFPCSFFLTAFTLSVLTLLFVARLFLERLIQCRSLLARQREENEKLHSRLSDNRRLIKTLQYAARLEERNRLAARIHDKIGHGVSGSILLLEAAMLTMEQSPAASRKTVEQAVSNLRESVDDIRMSLRSERSTRSEAGLSEIKLELARFSDAHAVRTAFKPSGRVEELPGYLWNCIYETLLEALTNLLKHSDATAFTLRLSVASKIVRVEFRDNGRAAEQFEKGMGLETIEERVILNGGRCFFQSSSTGFVITQIFLLEG